MPIKTILVNLDIDESNSAILRAAVDIAARLDARVIGHCAADVLPLFVGAEGADVAATIYADLRADIAAREKRARKLFDTEIPADIAGGWYGFPDASATTSLIDHAGLADLILVGRPGVSPAGPMRSADLGDVILAGGRPVLAVPAGNLEINPRSIVIGWKNTREARRAVADALPLLQLAGSVVVATVAESEGHWVPADDVLSFLRSHDIDAVHVTRSNPDAALALTEVCQQHDSTLLVTGAYGHHRWRERLLGGVTEALIRDATLCRLFSS